MQHKTKRTIHEVSKDNNGGNGKFSSESLPREKKQRQQSESRQHPTTVQGFQYGRETHSHIVPRLRSFSLPSLELIQPFIFHRPESQTTQTSFINTESLISRLPSEIVDIIFSMLSLRELLIVEAVSRTWFWRSWRAQIQIDFSPLRSILDNTLLSVLSSRLYRAKIVSFKDCTKLTGFALTSLQHLTLSSLNLCEESYTAYLEVSPVSYFTTLTSLNLKRYFPMNHLTCIRPLTSLRHLVIAAVNGPELTEDVFPTTLRSLEIYNVKFDVQNEKERGFYDTNMTLITNLINLEHLYLDCTYVSDNPLNLVSLFTNLRVLTLYDVEMAVVSLNLSFLTTLRKLEQFDCDCMLVKSKHLTPINQLSNLTKLRILLGAPTLSGLSALTTLRDLTLNCEHYCFTDGYDILTALSNLQKLELQFGNIELDHEEFVAFDQMSTLTQLRFQGDFRINLHSQLFREYTHLGVLLSDALHHLATEKSQRKQPTTR